MCSALCAGLSPPRQPACTLRPLPLPPAPPQLGKAPTIDHLVPVFLNLLRDPYPDVRLNVISKLDQVCSLV